jgi:tetratricopeptide (TPR) repeat protein
MSMTPQALLEQMRKALVLQRDGKTARARSIYERILKQDPANAEATNLLALCFLEQNYPKRALTLLERAISLAPSEARYHLNLSDCHDRLGDQAASLAAIDAGLSITPDDAGLLRARAQRLLAAGRTEEAIGAFDKAVRAAPQDTDLLADYGHVLLLAGQFEQAAKVFRFVLQSEPAHRIALLGLADALNQIDQPGEALALLRSSVEAFAPDEDAEYQLHLANALWGSGRFTEALSAIDRVLALGHRTVDTCLLRGKALYHLGRFAEARAELEAALAADPGRSDVAMTLGFCCLSLGDLVAGWGLAEQRFDMKAKGVIRRRFQAPTWQGEALGGKTLMVWDDQGIGDVLRSSSMLKELRARCQHLILECHPKLLPLMTRNFPDIEVRERRHDGANALLGGGEDFDVQCSLGSLPLYLRRSLESFPDAPGFLVAEGNRIDELRKRPPLDGVKPLVGLSWTSGNRSGLRARSYLTLADLLPLLTTPDVEFVLLDYTDRRAEIAALRNEHDFTLHHWSDLDLFDDLETVGALVACMDLVISANTSVADMSGALGVPTWRFGPVTGVTLLGQENPPWNPATRYLRLEPEAPANSIVPRLQSDLNRWLASFSRA